jgi:hypothetical protein
MSDDTTIPGGASGEQAPPVADGSSVNVDEILKAVDTPEPPAEKKGMDPAFLEQLGKIDPRELPDELRTKLEAPFLSNFSKKTTDIDNERKRWMDTIEKLSSRPAEAAPPPPDQTELLRQRLAEGDLTAVESIVNQMVDAKTGPQMRAISLENMARYAGTLEPTLASNQDAVAAVIAANPRLGRLLNTVGSADPELGGQILAGIAKTLQVEILSSKLKAMESSIEGKVKRAIDETQKRLKAIPSSTSQAGRTPSATVKEGDYDRLRVRDEAWREAGGG